MTVDAKQAIAEIKKISSELGKYNTQVSKSREQTRGMLKETTSINKRLDTLKSRLSVANKNVKLFGNNLGTSKTKLQEFNAGVKAATRGLNSLGSLVSNLQATMTAADKKIKELTSSLDRVASSSKTASTSVRSLDEMMGSVRVKAKDVETSFVELSNSGRVASSSTNLLASSMQSLDVLMGAVQKKATATSASLHALSGSIHASTGGGRPGSLDALLGASKPNALKNQELVDNIRADHNRKRLTRLTQAHQKNFKATLASNKAQENFNNLLNKGAAPLQKTSRSLADLTFSFRNVARIAASLVLYTAFSRLISEISNAIRRAKDFEKAIGEIQTISEEAARSSESWRTSLMGVSNAFGVDTLEAAEGAYQALSDQVTNATNTISFLNEEVKLSIITVSSLDQSIQTTNAILNAFNENVSAASRVNADLFKAVDLGRLRLEELSNTIGRVSILSSQLGVSFRDQFAALTLLTRQGIKAEEAITLLRNVELKLIKPTDRMKEIFRELGVQSGEAAVKTFGLVGTLERIAEITDRSGDTVDELGKAYGRLRAIVGATALSQKSFREETEKFGDSGDKALQAFLDRLDDFDTRASQQVERLQNFFTETLGRSALEAFVEYSEAAGGAEQVLINLSNIVGNITVAFLGYKAALIATSLTSTALAGTSSSLAVALAAINPVALGVGLAVGIATTAFLANRQAAIKMRLDVIAAGNETEATFKKLSAINLSKFNTQIDKVITAITEDMTEMTQTIRIVIAELNKLNNSRVDALDDQFKNLGESIEENFGNAVDNVSKKIDAMRDRAKQANQAIQDAQKNLRDSQVNKAIDQADRGTPQQRIRNLSNLANQLDREAQQGLAQGNRQIFDELSQRADELRERIRRDLEEAVKKLPEDQNTTPQQKQTINNFINAVDKELAAVDKIKQGRRKILELVNLQVKAEQEYQRALETGNTEAIEAASEKLIDVVDALQKAENAVGGQLNNRDKAQLDAFQNQRKPVIDALRKQQSEFDFGRQAKAGLKQLEQIQQQVEQARQRALTNAGKQELPAQQAATAAEEAINKMKEALEEASDIDPSKATKASIDEFINKIREIDQAIADAQTKIGKAPGQTGLGEALAEARKQFLEDAEKIRKALEQSLANNAVTDTIDQANEAVGELESKLKKARQEYENLLKQFGQAVSGDTVDELANQLGQLEEFSKNLRPAVAGEEGFTEEDQARLKKRVELQKALTEGIERAKTALKDASTSQDLAGQQAAAKRLAETLANLQRIIFDLESSDFQKDKRGDAGALGPDNLTGEVTAQITATLEKLKAAEDQLNQSKQKSLELEDALNQARNKARELIGQLPAEQQAAVNAALNAAQARVEAERTVQDALRETISIMEQLIQKSNEAAAAARAAANAGNPPGAAFGGVPRGFAPPKGFAFGGQSNGIDRRPALLADGEIVMTQQASRMAAPFLHALNRAGAGTTNNTSSNVTFGDINLNVPQGTSPEQVDYIARELKRRARVGL